MKQPFQHKESRMTLRPYEIQWLHGISPTTERRRRYASGDFTRYRNDWTVQDRATLAANLHLSDKQIGAMIGRSAMSVKRYRQRNGIVKGQERGWGNYKGYFKQYRKAA